MPISVRLLVTIGVPLFALCCVLGAQVQDARAAGRDASANLARAEVLRAAAALQSAVVAPEMARDGIASPPKDAPIATSLILGYMHDLINQHAADAQHAFDAVMASHGSVVPAGTRAAFQAQAEALRPVLDGDGSAQALRRLTTARAAADDALTDMFISSETPWFIYQGVIELNRTRYFEVSALLPTLSGFGRVSPTELSVLSGARANAVTRSGFGSDEQIRQQIKGVLQGTNYRNYTKAVAIGVQIAAGNRAPLPPARVQQVATTALALSQDEDKVSKLVQDQAANTMQLEVAQAQQRQRLALLIAAATLAVTLFLAVLALRSIVVPLRALTRRAVDLAAGRLNGVPVPVVGRDELTRLAIALEGSAATLLHVNAQAQAIADGRMDDPCLESAAPGPFGQVLHDNVVAVQAQASRLRHAADHDPMTGLMNRAALERALAEPLAPEVASGASRRWLFYLDLDGFKEINDVHGHDQGDDVLRAVAQRLLRAVRVGDLVARLGGDEFVAVLTLDAPDGETPEELGLAVDRLSRAIRLPVPKRRSDGDAVTVGVSIGHAELRLDGTPLDAAMAEADTRMYAMKRAAKASYRAAGIEIVPATRIGI